MIDLTPLDVRNKRGDFKKVMRGYDPREVDVFLEIAAERLEALIRENMALKERVGALQAQVAAQSEREQAVQAALVTAQELRADIRTQAQREAEHILKAAETERRKLVAEAEAEVRTKLRDSERRLDKLADEIRELERRRSRFLKEFRQLLERELDVVAVEEERAPLEERTIELELGGRRARGVPPMRAGGDQDARPAPDASVGEFAAAYEELREAGAAPRPAAAGAPGGEAFSPPRPPAAATRPDELLLHLDTDERPAGS